MSASRCVGLFVGHGSASPPARLRGPGTEAERRHRWALAAGRAVLALVLLGVGLLGYVPVAAAQTEVPIDWPLKPAGLGAGDEFRLLFATSGTRTATTSNIASYNTFVQDQAASGHPAIQPYSSGFRVVGCTSAVDARDNTMTTYTSSDKGVPIFWLNGSRVASDYEDFYDGSWGGPANPTDQRGNSRLLTNSAREGDKRPFTGCDADGTKDSDRHLGAGRVLLGNPENELAPSPFSPLTDLSTDSHPFYALSQVFRVGRHPNRPPLAMPEITGLAETGRTLTARTDGISDPDGLSDPNFRYRWIRVDGDRTETVILNEAGASYTYAQADGSCGVGGRPTTNPPCEAAGSTYTLGPDDAGKRVKVRVTFTDDGGSTETLESESWPKNGTILHSGAPTVDRAWVEGRSLVLLYSEELDPSPLPARNAWSVEVGGSTAAPSGRAVNGREVTLTLPSAVAAGDDVEVSYSRPSNNRLRDLSGTAARSFTDRRVANHNTNGPKVRKLEFLRFADDLLVWFDQDLRPDGVPEDPFTIKVDGTPEDILDDARVSTRYGENILELKLTRTVRFNREVTVSYDGDVLRNARGDRAPSFFDVAAPVLSRKATVSPPRLLEASGNGVHTRVNRLRWRHSPETNDGTHRVRYELQWSADGAYWEVLARDIKGTWYEDRDVCAGERYHYRIRAYRYVKALGDIGYSEFRGPASRKVPGDSGDCGNKRGASGVALSRAVVAENGERITLRFHEEIDGRNANLPNPPDFELKVNGAEADVTGIDSTEDHNNAREFALSLGDTIRQGDIVTLSYRDPTPGDDREAIQDPKGNDASSFFDFPVENGSVLIESACQAGDIWCATMTVGRPYAGHRGYLAGSGAGSIGVNISARTFTIGEQSFLVHSVLENQNIDDLGFRVLQGSNGLDLTDEQRLVLEAGAAAFVVGGKPLAFADVSEYDVANGWVWTDTGLFWSTGDTVALRLVATLPEAPPAPEASTDASLAKLALHHGGGEAALRAFGFDLHRALVPNSASTVAVTAGPRDPGATVELLDEGGNAVEDLDPGTRATDVALDVGRNVFTVRVTAADGVTATTRTLELARAAAAPTGACDGIWCANLTLGVLKKLPDVQGYITDHTLSNSVKKSELFGGALAPDRFTLDDRVNRERVTHVVEGVIIDPDSGDLTLLVDRNLPAGTYRVDIGGATKRETIAEGSRELAFDFSTATIANRLLKGFGEVLPVRLTGEAFGECGVLWCAQLTLGEHETRDAEGYGTWEGGDFEGAALFPGFFTWDRVIEQEFVPNRITYDVEAFVIDRTNRQVIIAVDNYLLRGNYYLGIGGRTLETFYEKGKRIVFANVPAATINSLMQGAGADLSIRLSRTRTGAAQRAAPREPTGDPLTASFGGAPARHDGQGVFTVELAFSETLAGMSFKSLRDHLLSAAGGTVTAVRRAVPTGDDRNRVWEVDVEPSGEDKVVLTLPPGPACGEEHAMCTVGGRPLETGTSVTVPGPATLLATLEPDVERHGGEDTVFALEMTFSPTLGQGKWKEFRDHSFDVSGGTVTGVRRVVKTGDERNRVWTVDVEPAGDGDVTVTLLPSPACGEEHAMCTAAGRRLETGATVTVPGPVPLTAQVVDFPSEHDGTSAFTVAVRFSEDIRNDPAWVYRAAGGTTGGEVTASSRHQGSSSVWIFTVEPGGHGPVTFRLAGGGECAGNESAVLCTSAGRVLSEDVSIEVRGPAAVSVADAEATEAEGATMDFEVSLDRSALGTYTVDYATKEGNATEGADYVAKEGTLTFTVGGSRTKTVRVTILNDTHDDDGETFTLVLSNPVGVRIADGEATGTIRNADAMPRAWLARFGRTVAEQVLDAVEGRMRAPRAADAEVSLAGRRIGLGPVFGADGASADRAAEAEERAARREEAEAEREARRLAEWLQGETDPEHRHNLDARAVTPRELMLGASFALTAGAGDGPGGSVSLWGRGAASRFDGREGALTVDGEVTSALLGADWSRDEVTAGLIVGHSRGEGGYRAESGGGAVTSTLTGLYPWGRYALSERLSVWGVAGYGEGTLTLTPEGRSAMRADLDLAMGALGVRGVVVAAPEAGGPELAVKADAMGVRTATAKATGMSATEAEVTRLRLGLEGSWAVRFEGGGVLTPSLEVGVRHDGGDAETGAGADIGGGLAWRDAARGLSAELRGRGLLTHEAKGFRERGLSGSLIFDPAPDSARGLSLTLSQTVGAASGGGMDALLGRTTLEGLAANDAGGALGNRRLELRVGYGLAAFGDRFTLTPEAGFGHAAGARDYSLGWKLVRESRGGGTGSLELSLEARRHENDNAAPGAGAGEHTVGARLSARW